MKRTHENRLEAVIDYIQSGLSQKRYVEQKDPCSLRAFQRWCVKYRAEAEQQLGMTVKGTSTLYDADGNVKLNWVKRDAVAEDAIAKIKAFADGLKDDIPRAKPIPPPQTVIDNLLTCYVLTDLHIGMRSNDWNMDIAEANIRKYFDEAIATAPASSTGVLCFQGDTGHFDSLEPVTPASKHVLDADCGARQMTRLIIKMIRYGIEQLLKKHNHVHLIYAEGNHDQYAAIHHSEHMSVHYEYEPRVSVDISDNIYHVVEWGNTSLFFHHGHKRNLSDISKTFASKFREVFGRTKYSYGHIGHYHHVKRKPYGDDGLMDLRIHPTLSGKDDYALRGGWESERGANVITYCREAGYKGEFMVRPI